MTSSMWNNISSIELSLDSMLGATTLANGEQAFNQSKLVGGGMVTVETTVVPVPAAVWLFGSGLLALAGFCRRATKRRI